jgi:transposase
MFLAKPIVGFQLRETMDLVGPCGIFAEEETPEALAKAILTLIDDSGLRVKMGKAGYLRARELFSWRTEAKKLIEVYDGLKPANVARVCTQIIDWIIWTNMIHRARRWVMRFHLSDEDWALLEPLLPKSRKMRELTIARSWMRSFMSCAPECRGGIRRHATAPYTTAYNRFNRWSRRGICKRVFDQLASKSRDSLYLIDSTIVKAHRAASGGKRREKN